MILRIEEIPPEGKEVSFELDLEKFNLRMSGDKNLTGPEPLATSAPKAELKAELSGVTVFLKGRSELEAETVCSRCSEPAEVRVDTKISMVLKPLGKSKEAIEDLDLSFYDGKEIKLDPIVEEQLILSLPYKVLCRPDCKGLCPGCGENLNYSECRCVGEKKVEEKEGAVRPFAGLIDKLKV